MKKITALLILAVLMLSLLACAGGGTTSGTEKAPDAAGSDIMYFANGALPNGKGYIKWNIVYNDNDEKIYEPYTQIALSAADIDGKLREYCRSYSDDNDNFFETFDEAFFEEHVLVCIGLSESPSTAFPDGVCLRSVEKGEKIEIELYNTESNVCSQDISAATVILVLDKGDIDGSEEIVYTKKTIAKN